MPWAFFPLFFRPPTLSNDRFAIFMPSSATFPWSEQTAASALSCSPRVKVSSLRINGTSSYLTSNRLKINKYFEVEVIRSLVFPSSCSRVSSFGLGNVYMSSTKTTLLGRLERQDSDARASDCKISFFSFTLLLFFALIAGGGECFMLTSLLSNTSVQTMWLLLFYWGPGGR